MENPRNLRSYTAFVPLLLLCLALLFWSAAQTLQLVGERNLLQQTHANQQQVVENALKMRNQLNTLTTETQKLADQGNANAKLIVEELKKRGVTIKTE